MVYKTKVMLRCQLSSVNIIFVPEPRKICHPSVVVLLFLLLLIAGGLMVFSVISIVSSFEDDDTADSVSAG